MGLCGVTALLSAQPVTINHETTTYDFHPSSATTRSGSTWYAWHGYSNGRDQILARRVNAAGNLGALHTVNDGGTVHGPPRMAGETDGTISVVWSTKSEDRWRVVLRGMRDNRWKRTITLSDDGNDAIHPTATGLSDGSLIAAWSAHVQGRWRIRGCRIQGD